jgi:hypothetical protein
LRQFVESEYGAGSFKKLREALVERHQIELPVVITPDSWLPTSHFVRGLEVARELWGPDDLYERFGRLAAEYELKWMHRIVLRFTSPIWLLEKSEAMWKKSHTTGHWKVSSKERWMRGELYDFAGSGTTYCPTLRSWLARACQMTGAEKIRVLEPECRGIGAKACVFEGSW